MWKLPQKLWVWFSVNPSCSKETFFFFVGLIAAICFMPFYGQMIGSGEADLAKFENIIFAMKLTVAFMTISNIINGYVDFVVDGKVALPFQRRS